jgi:hypothetical protein
MKNRDFLALFPLLNQLKEQKHVWVKVAQIKVFKSFCEMTGLNAQGGSLSEDATEQLIYID